MEGSNLYLNFLGGFSQMKCPVNFTLELQNKAREPGCCHVWPDGSSVAFCLKFYWFWLSRKKFGHLKQVKWDVCMFTVVLLIRYVFYNVTNFQQLWTNKVEVFVLLLLFRSFIHFCMAPNIWEYLGILVWCLLSIDTIQPNILL